MIDPVKPKPSHLYRRIYINPALSLLITPDPSSSERLQEIKVLGSDNEVAKCQNTITENLEVILFDIYLQILLKLFIYV